MVNKTAQISNGFVYLTSAIITNLLSILTLSILTRILTKDDYGIFALAQIYSLFVSGIANFGMTAAYERNFFQYRNDSPRQAQLLYSIFLFVIMNFIILSSITYFFKGHLSLLIIGTFEHGEIIFWAFCAQFLNSLSYYYLAYFRNSEVAKKFTFYTIVGSIINVFVSLFFVAYLRMGVIGLVYAQLCTGAIIFVILSYKFTKILTPSVDKTIFYESLRISYPLIPRIFLNTINTQFDKYMIAQMVSVGGVGIYSIGQRISNLVFTFMNAIEHVFSPHIYKKMFDPNGKEGESIGKYLTPFIYIIISVALLVSLLSEEIISILTPPSYHGAIDIVIIFSVFCGVLFFRKLNSIQLIFMKKTHIISFLTMMGIGMNIGLNIPFIMKWGVIGAAWATLIAGLITGTVSFVVSQHYYKIKWEYKKVGLIYFIFFASSISMVFLRNFDVIYIIRLMYKCISIAFFIYIGVRIRVITVGNYNIVKNILSFKDNILFQRNN